MGEKKIQIKVYDCERCFHTWQPRLERVPTVCPRCKSPYWNKKKLGDVD